MWATASYQFGRMRCKIRQFGFEAFHEPGKPSFTDRHKKAGYSIYEHGINEATKRHLKVLSNLR